MAQLLPCPPGQHPSLSLLTSSTLLPTHPPPLHPPHLQAESIGILATPDSLENRFVALEGGSGVDDDLAALKRGLLGAPKDQPAGQLARPLFDDVVQRQRTPEAMEIDAELEALRKRARS
jgi:hypothetical protein